MSLSFQANSDGSAVVSVNGNQKIKINADGGVHLGRPVFSAYQGTSQSIAQNVISAAITYSTKEFDSNNCYNNTAATTTLNGLSVPAYAFMPNVAGYYQITATIGWLTQATNALAMIYKNGARFKDGEYMTGFLNSVSALVYLNGTSDYIQITSYQGGTGSVSTGAAVNQTYFQAYLVEAA